MATTQNSGGAGVGVVHSVTDPTLTSGAAASAVGPPITNGVVTRVFNLCVSPIASGLGAGQVHGFVTVRDGATALGTYGVGYTSAASAGIAGPMTLIPLGFSYAYVTGLNVLWTSGTIAVSAAVNYNWSS